MQLSTTRRHVDVDRGARNLAIAARTARYWPPVFRATGETYPIKSPWGDHLGEVLPGVGIALARDLKELGITKPIPHVIERTPLSRALERELRLRETWKTAITTYDGIISGRAAGNTNDGVFSKPSYTTVASTWSNIFQSSGFPAAGAYTANPGAVQTAATTGALNFQQVSPSSNTEYLLTWGFCAAQQINMAIVIDQLVGIGGISATSTSTSITTQPALTRYTSGAGVMMTCDITTALGSSGANITVTYTNSASAGSRSTGAQAMLASGIVQRICPVALGPFMALQSGDIGVQSVQSLTLSGSMTAGVFAILLYKPLMFIPGIAANVYAERDSTTQIDGLIQQAKDGSNILGCYSMLLLTNTTSTGILTGSYRGVYG